jgi:putative PIN family toxin of toxin-antitoxin system
VRRPGISVVIDTNVWISGLISATGAPAEVTRRAILGGQPVFTEATFDELKDRLWRPKFDRYISMEHRHALLADLDAVTRWVRVPAEIAGQAYCRDVDDDKFLHAALAAQPAWLVTGDKDLLVLSDRLVRTGVTIVSPAEALARPAFAPTV